MTCQECQPLVIDLARGLPPFDVGGAVQRVDVLSHVATCKRCAQWLREQEALSDALRAAAEADVSLTAPPRVEANVMAAFRARQSQRSLPLARAESSADAENLKPRANPDWAAHRLAASMPGGGVARPDAKEAPASTWQRASARVWRPAWPPGRAAALAAAAIIVIAALTMASVRWLIPSATPPNAGTHQAGGASPALPPAAGHSGAQAGPSASAGARVTGAGTNAAVVEVLPDKGSKGKPARPRVVTPHAANARRGDGRHGAGAAPDARHESPSTGLLARSGFAAGAGAGRRDARETSVTGVASTTRRGGTARASNEMRGANEFTGPAFVLLPYVEPLRPTEMRHIMRVRMPRAQLAAGGVQADSTEDGVLADVLVGEDGTARAVRIVQ